MSDTVLAPDPSDAPANSGPAAVATGREEKSLKKNLKLFDVYAMATGAMFSSGLFLLPGIAAAQTGNSVWLAYLFAGFLIVPAMLCMAELSTAMPKSGGTYFFLDRALGPLFGTIGGLGSWIAVVFKAAFALVGMGAYLTIYFDLPITLTALLLTLVFGVINLLGGKETALLQRILVGTLVVILTAFVIAGLASVGVERVLRPDPAYGGYFSNGVLSFVGVIGLVFVSYAGLTKVTSVAEEIENPNRNIPLGMVLSLLTATVIYSLGTLILVTVLTPPELIPGELIKEELIPPGMLREDIGANLTPVAAAGEKFLGWLPNGIGVALIVVSAVAAFASTGNAGIMAASRYPFAMARDNLLPARLARVSSFGTPAVAIIFTVVTMLLVLLLFDVEEVAKLASAFQLLLFGLVSVVVIVMREARISSYSPGFKVPLYPWLPIIGIFVSFWLIIEMGLLAIGFTGMVVILSALWYQFYAAGKVRRRGAIFHVHERLGRQRYEGVEHELMSILHDRTQAQNLSYETVVAKSAMKDLRSGEHTAESLAALVIATTEERFGIAPEKLAKAFSASKLRFQPVSESIAVSFHKVSGLEEPALVVMRFSVAATLEMEGLDNVHTLMVLFTPTTPFGIDLRIVGHLAEVVQGEGFEGRWLTASSEQELNEILMRDDHFIHAPLSRLPFIECQAGCTVGEIELPGTCLMVMIERGGDLIIARPGEMILEGDLVAIIGEPEDLAKLMRPREPEDAGAAEPA